MASRKEPHPERSRRTHDASSRGFLDTDRNLSHDVNGVAASRATSARPATEPTPLTKGDALAELHGAPGHLIRRSQQIAVAIFMEETKAFDLTPVQYATLV